MVKKVWAPEQNDEMCFMFHVSLNRCMCLLSRVRTSRGVVGSAVYWRVWGIIRNFRITEHSARKHIIWYQERNEIHPLSTWIQDEAGGAWSFPSLLTQSNQEPL